MLVQLIQAAQSMTDMVVLITMKMAGQTMTEHGFTATVISKIGSKSKTAMVME